MKEENLKILQAFREENLPDLDTVTLGALELFATTPAPLFDFSQFKRPLVVGSGNAQVTGRILFEGQDAVFADESTYKLKLENVRDIDGAVLISASGSKHAVGIAEELQKHSLATWLLTNNAHAPAKAFVKEEKTLVFLKNREPYTYNTSTYMGMILSRTKESAPQLHSFLVDTIAPLIPDRFSQYNAFFLLVPEEFDAISEMFVTKFDELFGPLVQKRVFTFEQAKHAKTVVPSDRELFVSFGKENQLFGRKEQRLHIPLPENAGYGAMMAAGYYVIGRIQNQLPPYFKEHIASYVEETSKLFNSSIPVIVE